MNLEFDISQTNGEFKNGTLFVNPNILPEGGFFIDGPGHDVLHGLTQNLQQHFGAISSSKPKSKANTLKISYQRMKKFLDQVKKEYSIDLEKEDGISLPRTKMSDAEKQDWLDKVIKLVRRYQTQPETQNRDTWIKIGHDLNAIRFAKQYWDDPDGSTKEEIYNSTHSIEEEMGNIVGNEFVRSISSNSSISSSNIEEIEMGLESKLQYQEFYYSAAPNPNNKYIVEEWYNYLMEIVPKFARLYNRRVEMLKKTKFGQEEKNVK